MEAKNKIDKSFYTRDKVVQIARDLLGKVLCTRVNGEITKGMIVESEAYSYKERACHAYDNQRTKRTSVMFEEGGLSYVYLIYGIHNLFNIIQKIINREIYILQLNYQQVHQFINQIKTQC